MSRAYKFAKISPKPGVNPSPDSTPSNTPYWTSSDKVRFYNGFLRKIGGWQQVNYEGQAITGVCRRIFSYFYNGQTFVLLGTHTKLFEYVNGTVTNITPLKTSATATLGTDPLDTVDTTSTLTVNYTAHGLSIGDRIKLSGATDVGGITAATYINKEHIIATVPDVDSFTIELGASATSTTSGGGSSVDIYTEIAAGNIDYELGFGYGGGKFGIGKYGVGKAFISTYKVPRIWSMDRFGNDIVLTPGDGGKVYIYQNNNETAPTILTNSPSAADFLFVENNAVCVIRNNTFSASDLGDATVWTPAATNLAFTDNIEGADPFITSTPVRDGRLLHSVNQIWRLRYVGQASGLWSFELIDTSLGTLSPLSTISINGIAYWVGLYDFCIYDGGVPRPASNTVKQYVISQQSASQYYKSYVWENRAFNEIWFHYPSTSGEPEKYIIYNYIEGHFTPGTMDRTAAEYPYQSGLYPLLIDSDNTLWYHEAGNNNGDSALSCYAETNLFMLGNGDSVMNIMGLRPDSTQVGNVDVEITTQFYPQSSTNRTFGPYAISATTEKTDTRINGRLAKYKFSQDAINETFIMGGWYQGVQEGTLR